MDHDRLFKELLTNFFSEFVERMFRYFSRLTEKHRLPVFPVALLSYDKPLRKEPDRYRVEFPGQRVLDFKFRTVQLNRLNWRDFVRNPNPVASALMTKMSIAPKDRPKVKLECLRMMITLRLDPARATLIFMFMESYLRLTAVEKIAYDVEVEKIDPKEREVFMEWTNEWIEKGKAEGVLLGRRELVLALLRRRFGGNADSLAESLSRLSAGLLDQLGVALFDFKTLADAQRWLAQHP
jgi:hypothetical protein